MEDNKKRKPWLPDYIIIIALLVVFASVVIFVGKEVLACKPEPPVATLLIIAMVAMIATVVFMTNQIAMHQKKNMDLAYPEDEVDQNEKQ